MLMDEEKKSKSAVLFIAIGIFCLAILGYFILSVGSTKPDQKGKNNLANMQEMTGKVGKLESSVKQKEGQMASLASRYEDQTGKETPRELFLKDLTPQERKFLEQQIGEEKDVSAKSMLREILKKRDEIDDLKNKISEIEDRLPSPHIAQKGESHYQIALAFLIEEKGIEEKEAAKILSRTALFEELAEGFKIWNFLAGNEYGTSVTQGNAQVSPNVFVHRAKKRLIEARDAAVSEQNKLTENLKDLEAEQENTIIQLGKTTQEKQDLVVKVSHLKQQVNSMFYRLDSQKNLEKKGILKRRGFLRSTKLKDVSPENFDRSLDLDADDQVFISAADLGMKKISDVVLYPKFYKKGTSYKVFIAPNKKHALLTVNKKENFKSKRVIIAVR